MADVLMVAGLGRCGSSLAMQMLERAGVSCVGRFPDFEVDEVCMRPVDPDWIAQQSGRAMKWLNPAQTPLPKGVRYTAVWLSRSHREQAKSQMKFLRLTTGFPGSRSTMLALQRSIARDEEAFLRAHPSCNVVTYEDMLQYPLKVAAILRAAAAPICSQFDMHAAASAVKPRAALCATGLDMELSLIEQCERATEGGE